jgi:hypothetical protein
MYLFGSAAKDAVGPTPASTSPSPAWLAQAKWPLDQRLVRGQQDEPFLVGSDAYRPS